MTILNAKKMRAYTLEALARQRIKEKDSAQALQRRNNLWKKMYEAAIDSDESLDLPNFRPDDISYFQNAGLTVSQIDIVGDNNKTYKSKLNQINKTIQKKQGQLDAANKKFDYISNLIISRFWGIDKNLLQQWANEYLDFAYTAGFDDWFELDSDDAEVNFTSLSELKELKAAAKEKKKEFRGSQDGKVIDELLYVIALTEKSYISEVQWENMTNESEKLEEEISCLNDEIYKLEDLADCAESNCIEFGDDAKTIHSISWSKIHLESNIELDGYNAKTLSWLISADGKLTLKNIGSLISDAAANGQSKILIEYETCKDNSLIIAKVNSNDDEDYFLNMSDFLCIIKILDYRVRKVSGDSESGLFELVW